MTTSVLIIAHNEERDIKRCIESVLNQTQKPDEVVLIAHNCTDATETIARTFPVSVVSFNGPEGIPYARIKGFEVVKGDIVACIDGDAFADRTWLHHLTAPLLKNKQTTLVAGYTIITNSGWSRVTSWWQFVVNRKIFKSKQHRFAWGSNVACRKADYEKVGGLTPILSLKENLGLHFYAVDVYLSLALQQLGTMHVAITAKVFTTLPSWKLDPRTAPIKEWKEDNQALFNHFHNMSHHRD